MSCSETTKQPNNYFPECARCSREYEKWCSYFEAKQTCDFKQYLAGKRIPFEHPSDAKLDALRRAVDGILPFLQVAIDTDAFYPATDFIAACETLEKARNQ